MHNKWYYGVRYAKGCHPDELWKTYFTSSKHVKYFAMQYGAPDVIKIRKKFNSIDNARLWENRVLKKMKVINRNDFINKSNNISIAPMYGNANTSKRLDVREKISSGIKLWHKTHDNPMLGKTWSQDKKKEWSNKRKGTNNPYYGHRHTHENIIFYSEQQLGEKNSFYGKTHSEEQKSKWSKQRKGIEKPRICCVFCQNDVAINLFTRWHGDNCRLK